MNELYVLQPTYSEFKQFTVYKSALAFIFCLYRNFKSYTEILLVDKLGSSLFPFNVFLYPFVVY